MDSLAALMKRNAFRLWNVASPNPDGAGWLLMRLCRFRMVGEKRLHLRRIGLTRARVRTEREELLVKVFGRAEREYRQMEHRSSPLLAVRQGELESQAARGGQHVGREGIAAP